MSLIYVCRTCDRNAEPPAGLPRPGAALAAMLRTMLESAGDGAEEEPWQIREVACLNGCLKPCNVAFRGTDRYSYRFSRLGPDDLDDLMHFGRAYCAAPAGEVGADRIPPALRAKLTVCTPPRGRWQDDGRES